jgi:peptidyl-prolyl cis-trans isomerase D
MLNIIRKHRNWLWIVILILTIPFCIYFVKSDPGAIRSDEYAKMYGRKISLIEARRDARLFGVAQMLGISDLTDALAPGSGSDDQRAGAFIVNLTVLRHEADRLGIEPAESEIVDTVRNFPGFHGESGFDSARYDKVEREILPSFGFTDEQLRELARYALCLKKIKDLVGSSVSLPESEAKSNYEQLYGRNFVTVVHVRTADMLKDIKVSDDDIKKYYESHKSELNTEPKRKIEFVRLALTDEQKKLKDKERIDALQKLSDRANDVSQALLEKGTDFHQVAAKFQLPVETTGEFAASAPDPKLKTDSQLNSAAFKLTQQEPFSDPVQSAYGFAILHLVGVTEARPLTLDEAKQKIVDAIKNQQARDMAMAKGRKAAETLRSGLKAGQPLQFTLEQAGGLKAGKMEPFTLSDDVDAKNPQQPKNESVDMMIVKNVAGQLQSGEVSDFAPGIDGGVIVLMDKREPPDPAKYQEAKEKFEERYLKAAREYVFDEWLRDRQRSADIQFPASAKG